MQIAGICHIAQDIHVCITGDGQKQYQSCCHHKGSVCAFIIALQAGVLSKAGCLHALTHHGHQGPAQTGRKGHRQC